MSRLFDLETILTSTTGRLLTKPVSDKDNGIGELYRLLDYLTDEAQCTLSLGTASDASNPYIYFQHPELRLAENDLHVIDSGSIDAMSFVDFLKDKYGFKGTYRLETNKQVKEDL